MRKTSFGWELPPGVTFADLGREDGKPFWRRVLVNMASDCYWVWRGFLLGAGALIAARFFGVTW